MVPPVEAAFQAHMAAWRLDGQPRTARRYTTDRNCPLPTPEDRWRCLLVYLNTDALQVVQGRLFGRGQSQAHQWLQVLLVVLQAPRRTLGDAPDRAARGGADLGARVPPVGHAGTERRLERPQAPTEPTRGDRGKNKGHTVKHVRLINAALTSLLLRDTSAGRVHAQRMADTTPYPWPAGRRWLQDLGFLAFTLDQVEVIMPTKKPRGRALTRAQTAANRRIARRRVRIEHVNRRIKRCRLVHETSRLRTAGGRDRVMDICGALHTFRVRLVPWQPMV